MNIDLIGSDLLNDFVDGNLELLGQLQAPFAKFVLFLFLNNNLLLFLMPAHLLYHPFCDFAWLSFGQFYWLIGYNFMGVRNGFQYWWRVWAFREIEFEASRKFTHF